MSGDHDPMHAARQLGGTPAGPRKAWVTPRVIVTAMRKAEAGRTLSGFPVEYHDSNTESQTS